MDTSFIVTVILFPIAFAVAAFNTAVGPTGGALISSLSLIIPPPLSLFLHAITGIFASSARAISMWKYINQIFMYKFILGTILGLSIAFSISLQLPIFVWTGLIGLYLILTTFVSEIQYKINKFNKPILISALSGFISFYVGTGGKIISPIILSQGKNRYEVIATQSACVVIQHAFKAVWLVFLIPSFWQYWPYVASLFLGSLLGNYLGAKLLTRLNNKSHKVLQRTVLGFLGIALIIKAIVEYLDTLST